MQHYEMLFISPVQANEKKQNEILEKIIGLATSLEMKITENKDIGRKKLAYPVKKVVQGYYFLIEFDAEQPQIKKFDRELKLMPDIVRYLIIKKKVKTPEEIRKQKATQERIRERKIKEEQAELAKEKTEKEEKKGPVEKIKLEDLDKKLDEILKEEV